MYNNLSDKEINLSLIYASQLIKYFLLIITRIQMPSSFIYSMIETLKKIPYVSIAMNKAIYIYFLTSFL